MSGDMFYQPHDVAPVADRQGLSLARSRLLYDAVARHEDYDLIELLRRDLNGRIDCEFLVVEVRCDGVPSRNKVGIDYRERLALYVPANAKELVGVWALRRDFPVLMHQNQGTAGAPASLCLYFEPTVAVHRTWTEQSFLRRIQWWLEKSARGELHPADQPVEQLFFQSRFELVLPWNLEALRQNPDNRFVLGYDGNRVGEDAGITIFLLGARRDEAVKQSEPIELVLAPVVHGFVESDPRTLGELADILARRGADLLVNLKDKLQERVDEKGVSASADTTSTVILLHIPICRVEGEVPSKFTRRAFLLRMGGLALGEATGALMKHEQTYFREAGLLGAPVPQGWRALEVHAMSVLYANDASAARAQSGIDTVGPKGVLIGAGSLGSAMQNLWSRSGWGTWTVVDRDHIKPHNLSRHIGYSQHIGQPKAEVVASLNAAVSNGAVQVRPLNLDATNLDEPALKEAFVDCELVVDASTTLEYPRAASGIDALPRHVSVFITPEGNAGVFLAEDALRTLRLRTLEAQYYRAVIQSDWGANHLAGQTASFWSGTSCRDISVVMPYSRILNQACTLAEQVQLMVANDSALIRVWQRDPNRGATEMHEVPVSRERKETFGAYDLFFDDGLEAQLRGFRDACLPRETGGVLLGYYDFNLGAIFIVAALPAPEDSKGDSASFERGVAGLKESVAEVQRRTAGVVGYIGEWHSHPPGHSATPSLADYIQLAEMAVRMSDDGLPAVQLIVGEHDLQILKAVVG